MDDYELILDSDEWFSIRDEDEALVIHDSNGPQRVYPFHLYYVDQTEEEPTIKLIFDEDNGECWEEYDIPPGFSWEIADGDLLIYDESGEADDVFFDGDYKFVDGQLWVFDDTWMLDEVFDFAIGDLDEEDDDDFDDEFGLFGDLPYDERRDTDGWKSSE